MPSREFFVRQSLLNLGPANHWRAMLPFFEAAPDWYDTFSYQVGEIRSEFKHQVAKYER